ncbi:hypothetical protein [Halobacterium jilantaiense]|uniref:Uncharacterized protein n=1 Tax=Halobacterium jilantaiense TaxID=355548 RepID=A0A1I0PCR9_9EURY|nr:hypothetical protein [Halobacterium jilantaiense]SEW12066.1 hypothetical protein SAMN04487945_1589 [Halobacterium jilantaiense]
MRHTVLAVAALVVVGLAAPAVVASPAAAPADAGGTSAVQEADGNETANETAPGARLAGVVNVQGAEVEGEVAERSFGRQLAAAKSNASKASVLADQTGDLSERVAELRDRKQALRNARDNGTISQGRYRAEMARVAAELSTANRLLNRTASEARTLSPRALADAGVDSADLDRLRAAAGNLSGPEIAAIARDVGGPPVNRSVGPPGNRTQGPPSDVTAGPPGNETEGPPGNSTRGPPGNGTEGPPSDRTQGPPGNDTRGSPGNDTQGPPGDDTGGPPENSTNGPPGNGPVATDVLPSLDRTAVWLVAASVPESL